MTFLELSQNYGFQIIIERSFVISKLHIYCFFSYTKLRDDPSLRWRDEIVSEVVLHTIESQDIDTVITFDRHGISGHKNHCALYTAMAFLCLENRIPASCRVFALRSVTIFRKYSSILDVPMSFLFCPSAAYVAGKINIIIMEINSHT